MGGIPKSVPGIEVWQSKRLDELGKVVSGSTPRRSVPGYWGGGIPWLTPGEMSSLKGRVVTATASTLTPAGLASSSASLVPADSLLVTTRATLGARALAGTPVATNQGFKNLVFGEEADPAFFYQLFGLLTPELERRASGTTFLEISGSEFSAIEVSLPPLPEQRRIAEILDTVDEAIRKTDQVIEKLKALKQGLLYDLLTRGIDENGELRDPERHPEQFKDSPLGRIPREWEALSLRDLLSEQPVNGIYKPTSQIGSGTLMVGQVSIGWDQVVDPSKARRAQCTRNELVRFGLRPGDILVRRVFATVDGVGRPAFVDRLPERAVFESNMIRLRIEPTASYPRLVFLWLESAAARSWIRGRAKSSNQSSLSRPGILGIPAPGIPLPEQSRMSNLVSALEQRIASARAGLEKLRLLKQGLMDDLLTGKVRVNVPDEAA